jgi:hypothetical protein
LYSARWSGSSEGTAIPVKLTMLPPSQRLPNGTPCAAASALASGAMWGGSGAVWEVGGFGSEEERRTYWKALCRLIEEMRSRGISSTRAESTAKILAEWIEKGI